jgi:hypothetical protein
VKNTRLNFDYCSGESNIFEIHNCGVLISAIALVIMQSESKGAVSGITSPPARIGIEVDTAEKKPEISPMAAILQSRGHLSHSSHSKIPGMHYRILIGASCSEQFYYYFLKGHQLIN